jgi:hypothetical protein
MEKIDFSEIEIYEGKTFDQLLKQIHINSEEKSEQITSLITKLTAFIKNPDDAAMLVPLVATYLEVGVKNDDQLIKLAAIIQRVIKANQNQTSTSNSDRVGLTESEIAEIIENSKDAGNKVIKMKTS